MNFKTKIYLIVGIVILISLFNSCGSLYNSGVGLYNTTATYKLQYERKQQEVVTFFDAKYLAFSKKENIANVNKDAFIVITSIIMSNRRDGQQLAWKWVHENQNIPYEEFTSFYRDLSSFVEQQYGGIFEIEKDKQNIVAEHNRLLTVYPNNVLNKFPFMHIPPLVYKAGYLSDSTKRLFNIQ